MSINRSAFGRLEDGRQIERYELQSSGGLKLSVLTYGATIQSLVFDGRDVVLGYDRLEDYLVGNDSYQGRHGWPICQPNRRGPVSSQRYCL